MSLSNKPLISDWNFEICIYLAFHTCGGVSVLSGLNYGDQQRVLLIEVTCLSRCNANIKPRMVLCWWACITGGAWFRWLHGIVSVHVATWSGSEFHWFISCNPAQAGSQLTEAGGWGLNTRLANICYDNFTWKYTVLTLPSLVIENGLGYMVYLYWWTGLGILRSVT